MILTAAEVAKIYNTNIEATIKDCKYTIESLTNQKVFQSTREDKKEIQLKIDGVYNIISKPRTKYIDSKKFTFIVSTFMEIIVRKMIYEGFVFRVYLLGAFRVVRTQPTFRMKGDIIVGRVNFNATNKLKEKLLSEGKEIYTKENPKGEKYVVYHTEETPFFRWFRNKAIENIHFYLFRINTSENGPVRELMGAVKRNPLLMNKYYEK